MSDGHHIEQCVHGVTMSRCRCPGPHEVRTVPCRPPCKGVDTEAVTMQKLVDAANARAEAAEAELAKVRAERDRLLAVDADNAAIRMELSVLMDTVSDLPESAFDGIPTAKMLRAMQAMDEADKRKLAASKIDSIQRENAKLRGDLAAAQQALRAATEWRPIETAPRDGTWVMTTDKADAVSQPVACRWNGAADAWQDQFNDLWHSETHWLPIPPFRAEAQRS